MPKSNRTLRRPTKKRLKSAPSRHADGGIADAAEYARRAGLDPEKLLRRAARAEEWAKPRLQRGEFAELIDAVGGFPDPFESQSVRDRLRLIRGQAGVAGDPYGMKPELDEIADVLAFRSRGGRPRKLPGERERERFLLMLRRHLLICAKDLDRRLAADVNSEKEIRKAAEDWRFPDSKNPWGVFGECPVIVAAAIHARRSDETPSLKRQIEIELFRRYGGGVKANVPMVQTAGRPILTALRLLLGQSRLLTLPRAQRLPALLEDSRRFQNEVSERLAEQVLHALYELLRGFQAAHDASKGKLLGQQLAEHPDQVYRALLTVILRLVFLLYAEERDMLPEDETFLRHYSLAGLYERLREDAALFPDTMDQRYGAWAQLLVLFRMINDGAESGSMHLPVRHGTLFEPERFKFLEGRLSDGVRQTHERIEPPLVPDGTIYRVLEKLLILDGERISYRALDVEQIGSVYQAMMGFRLETATGRSVAIRSQKKWAAPTTVALDEVLAEQPEKRKKWLEDHTSRRFGEAVLDRITAAGTVDALHAALDPVIDRGATPDIVAEGAMVLQPSEERRRSGSHYTPRVLTEPIVKTALKPILARLSGEDGRPPKPEQILELKVCDPAMGSGAFLVETCRQLGDALIKAWSVYGAEPQISPNEDEVVFARRIVAQRCLYGMDRNPVAVDLAKVSLWLVTLAKDHALTFLDHVLRHGDSLVGLSRRQLEAFHWDLSKPPVLRGLKLRDSLDNVAKLRRRIQEADDTVSDRELREIWDEAQFELGKVRLLGDLILAAFFEGDSPKEREGKRGEYATAVVGGEAERYRDRLEEWRREDPPLAPFHWEIEFPEVFERENPGFDAIVGNPPFLGGRRTTSVLGESYRDWLEAMSPGSSSNADLCSFFFRRSFDLTRTMGAFGFIATKTIGQGDTRSTGLRWICQHGGEIFTARKRIRWPGLSAVVVSVLHVMKGRYPGQKRIDGRAVETITAFLSDRGGHDDPSRLARNAGKSFQGSIVLGMGFTFDDTDMKGIATPLSEMRRLIERDPRNGERIFPYIGGEEINTEPTHMHHRYVINFGDMSEREARRWPDLMAILDKKVRPERAKQKRTHLRTRWWQHAETRPALYRAVAGLERILAHSFTSAYVAFPFLPAAVVVAGPHNVFALDTFAAFCALQSRTHELWSRFFASSMGDTLRYTPTDCFETFPFPENWETHPALEAAGKTYYEFRASLMVRNNKGLTKTYNSFHDPDERNTDILRLRELHAAMDRSVLDAYGWHDIPTNCQFLLDYEIDEEEWGDRRKPYRYRWPDDVRDEVLARLLELNAQRAKEEARSGAAADKKGKPKQRAKRVAEAPETGDLLA